jgi:hypothetical protein
VVWLASMLDCGLTARRVGRRGNFPGMEVAGRDGFDAFERALFTRRRKEIYEAIHPETRNGQNQHTRVCQVGEGSASERFTADTASRTGRSERDVQRDAKIMVLCDRAMTNLREARSIEAVTAIRNAADAFAHYARKMKAAVEAKNECELVVLLAEARIGAELKAAQERGEVATQESGRPVSARASGTSPATLPEIGISSQRASDMKRLAEKGEAAIRDEVKQATSEGRRPSPKLGREAGSMHATRLLR